MSGVNLSKDLEIISETELRFKELLTGYRRLNVGNDHYTYSTLTKYDKPTVEIVTPSGEEIGNCIWSCEDRLAPEYADWEHWEYFPDFKEILESIEKCSWDASKWHPTCRCKDGKKYLVEYGACLKLSKSAEICQNPQDVCWYEHDYREYFNDRYEAFNSTWKPREDWLRCEPDHEIVIGSGYLVSFVIY